MSTIVHTVFENTKYVSSIDLSVNYEIKQGRTNTVNLQRRQRYSNMEQLISLVLHIG